MKYIARDGSSKVSGIPAQRVGAELEKIRKRTGRLETRDVVDAARPEGAPLHPAFTWDDEIAGENWRNWEARHLIRSVRVVTEDGPEPAFIHVSVKQDDKAERYYQSREVLATNIDEFTAAVGELAEKLAAAQRSMEEVKRIAQGGGEHADSLSMIAVAMEAMATARLAVERIQ